MISFLKKALDAFWVERMKKGNGGKSQKYWRSPRGRRLGLGVSSGPREAADLEGVWKNLDEHEKESEKSKMTPRLRL